MSTTRVIAARVLDASAVVAFATHTSVHAQALVWTAVEEGIVLVLPSTAVADAWTRLPEEDHPVLEVLLQLPVTVVDDLTGARARTAGVHGGTTLDAHAVVCARERGRPLITDDAGRYAHADGIAIDPLP